MVPVLVARGLVKSYRRRRIVDRVDLAVEPGERVAVLGPNGAGKTTTLLMCLGVVRPDAGTVAIAGHHLPRERAAARARVGFAAGYLPMPDRIRVREYLAVYGRLHGLDDVGERATAALRRFGIEHLASAMAAELSSGQKTLVGIVKATLHEPPLLVLDEPTASLDPDVANRVRAGLTDLCGPGRAALLLTSHNTTEVERLADRVVFLSDGRVVANDAPARVAAQFGGKDLEDVFLRLAGSPVGTER
ncbi:ABC transporter ATP-binding protein [Saccharothrix sp. S26]|uniref:ABC transporter ATP-binding protein n=1 Tax=Saccharothrix sp. S26 TaxID=2907215 RepID=UPI001F33128D|nr:ABC transporter ATP-binding protein [Saccharothrix sp. S26]MCE6995207.1 ABC transporter ATP-binding protein [Saccharothrix sp. S26]